MTQGNGGNREKFMDPKLIDLLKRVQTGERFFRPANDDDDANIAFKAEVNRLRELNELSYIRISEKGFIKNHRNGKGYYDLVGPCEVTYKGEQILETESEKTASLSVETPTEILLSASENQSLSSDFSMTPQKGIAQDYKGKVDFGIITIRDDEYQAVLDRLPTKILVQGKQYYSLSRLATVDGEEYLIALVKSPEQGNTTSQSVTNKLIDDLDPKWLVLAGIAGSVPEYEHTLGDVLVATRLQDFSISASIPNHGQEFDVRGGPMLPVIQSLAAGLLAIEPHLERWNSPEMLTVERPKVKISASSFYGDEDWKKKVRKSIVKYFGKNSERQQPKVFTGSVASSDRLIKDTELIQQWLETARQIRAVEMELTGVYQAAWDAQKPVLAVRGISDIVGFKRSAEWTAYACHTAASFLVALLRGHSPFPPLSSTAPDNKFKQNTNDKKAELIESKNNIKIEGNISGSTFISGNVNGDLNINYEASPILSETVIENLEQINNKQTEEIKNLFDESFKQYIKPVDIDSLPEVKEKLYFAEIDFAVELLREGKIEVALSKLEKLRAKVEGQELSIDLEFRLTANIGICHFHLDDLDAAETEFEQAIALKSDNKLILSHLSIVLSLKGDNERAVDLAIKSRSAEDNNSVIISNFIRVMNKAGRYEEISNLLETEEWIKQDPNCAISLGLIRFDEGNYEESESYFRIAYEGDKENPNASRLLAQTIIVPIDQLILNDPPVYLPANLLARLHEAEGYLTESIKILEKQENINSLFYALLQRAYIRDLLGETADSLTDCEWLLRIRPEDDEVLRQKGQTLLSSGKTKGALEIFNQLKDEKSKDEVRLAMALAYARTKNFVKVIDLLEEVSDISDYSRKQTILIDLLLSAFDSLGEIEKANDLVSRLDKERPNDSEILTITARHFYRAQKSDEAFDRYKKAISKATDENQLLRISIELADAYYESEKWESAAKLYSGKVDETLDNLHTRKFVASLYNSGARDKAFEIVKSLRNDGNAIAFYSEIEAEILIVLGDYKAALDLFEQIAKLEPQKLSHHFSEIELHHRLKNNEAAINILQKIKFDDIKGDVESLIKVAYWRQQLGMENDLLYAYQARRIGINDKTIHQAYMSLFMSHTKKTSGDLDIESINIDHSVYLENKRGEKIIYHILDQNEYDLSKGEIPLTDPRAQILMGLKTGDNVIFNEGKPNESQYKITGIKNKYLYAYQESIEKYDEMFGDDTGPIMVMDVADGDFSSLLKFLSEQRKRKESFVSKFKEGQMPLATLARLTGKSLFETWFSITQGSELEIAVSTGNILELEKNLELIKRSNEIVIDLSGLLTLCLIDMLDKLPLAFSRVIISNAVGGTLKKLLSEIESTTPYTTVWEEEGKYFHHEISQEIINNRHNFINELNTFIDKHVEIIPAAKVLTIPSEKLEYYNRAFGASFSSLLLANEYDLPIYLDDLHLGQISGILGWNVNGISIQIILSKFKALGLISQIEYWTALKKIILGNYVFILLDSNALWWMCADEGKRATEAIKKILKITFGAKCDEDSAVSVGTHFMYQVCLGVINQDEKIKLIDYTLSSILQVRISESLLIKLRNTIKNQFRFSSRLINLVYERIDFYVATNDGSRFI
jgi:nucleoside phosphorylase/tetratricopeptide (TPR) repeat protein